MDEREVMDLISRVIKSVVFSLSRCCVEPVSNPDGKRNDWLTFYVMLRDGSGVGVRMLGPN
jgi:hypothetical protein